MIVCDLMSGQLFCFKCSDYIFEPDVMTLNDTNWRRAYQTRGIPYEPMMNGVPFADRFLRYGGTPGTCLVPKATFGMRGLSLIHTPLLRDFFLSSKIDCKSEKHDSKQQKPCIITPLFELFQEFYNGSKTALSLHNLLPKIWDNAAHLAGYEQQDAHEFFIGYFGCPPSSFCIPFCWIRVQLCSRRDIPRSATVCCDVYRLRRFEHQLCKKIDTCVRFPEKLDLTPFTTHKKYYLYAVVNHIGSFEGGHYYAYIKHGNNKWFKCDDHIITHASRDEVLNSPGYLLFYHKAILSYDEVANQIALSID
ncbi:Ubiquitin carboxyl-terminal hydrolase nonstop [Orchesella cincta]|uniref:Ubiquitin carboxyl-terminal hydrolase nonstop n=1 Tax=Orchesella cincta TaxID=48709 RepID=A0A1D2N4F2_ORCCI|nr:Ubiquitin carboxyl-terminal hydrolase nonstop [Orchesella cincta]